MTQKSKWDELRLLKLQTILMQEKGMDLSLEETELIANDLIELYEMLAEADVQTLQDGDSGDKLK